MRAQTKHLIRTHTEEAATDIGRLRRRVTNELDLWTLDRISCHIQTIHSVVSPTAAELVNTISPGDPEAIVEAIRSVDQRAHQLRRRLGLEAA